MSRNQKGGGRKDKKEVTKGEDRTESGGKKAQKEEGQYVAVRKNRAFR